MDSIYSLMLFFQVMVLKMRGGDTKPVFEYDAIKMHVNNMDIEFPNQLFIDGQFVDATSGKFLKSINPATEELICDVSYCHLYLWLINYSFEEIFMMNILYITLLNQIEGVL